MDEASSSSAPPLAAGGGPFSAAFACQLTDPDNAHVEVAPLLSRLCAVLWPDGPDISSEAVEQCLMVGEGTPPLQLWERLTPKLLVASAMTWSRALIPGPGISNLMGRSLIHGWQSSGQRKENSESQGHSVQLIDRQDHDTRLLEVVTCLKESPALCGTPIHLYTILHYGLYLLSIGRCDAAKQSFEELRERTKFEDHPPLTDGSLWEQACFHLWSCYRREDESAGDLVTVSDITLVVDLIAIRIKNGLLEEKAASDGLILACSRGSRTHSKIEDSRAKQLLEYFRSSPWLNSTPLHLYFLLRYALHLQAGGKEEALELFREVQHLSSCKPELCHVQAAALISVAEFDCEGNSSEARELYSRCARLIEDAPTKDNGLLHMLAKCFMRLKEPHRAFEILTELLNSEGEASLSLTFSEMSEAYELLDEYGAAVILAEQAVFALESEGHGPSWDLAMSYGKLSHLLYHVRDIEEAMVFQKKAKVIALQCDQTHPDRVSILRLKAQQAYIAYQQDWDHGQEGGFRISREEAWESSVTSIREYEEAAVLLRGRSIEETIDVIQERFRRLKERKNVKLEDICSEGIALCYRYLFDGARTSKEYNYSEAGKVVVELYQRMLSHANSPEIATYPSPTIMDMAANLGEVAIRLGMRGVAKPLFSYVLSRVGAMQISLADASSEKLALASSNAYKKLYMWMMLLFLECSEEGITGSLESFIWADRSKARALVAQLCHVARFKMFADFDRCFGRFLTDQREFDTNLEYARDLIGNYLKRCHRTLILEYTIVNMERLYITATTAEVEGYIIHRYIDLEKELDEGTKKDARMEFLLLSERCLKSRSSERKYDGDSPDLHIPAAGFTPTRLVAENFGRSNISSVLLVGLVARVQRLEAEAEDAVQRKDERTAERKMEMVKEILGKLHDVLIKPFADFLECVLQGGHHNVLLIIPDEDISLVPFSALYDKGSGKYLIEQFAVAMAPSIRIASFCKQVFETLVTEPYRPELVVGRTSGYPPGWVPLKKAEKEMKAVRQSFSTEGRYLHFGEGEQNAKSRVLALLRESSWLHFTVHGDISEQYPNGSLLLGDTEEERLTADEISSCVPLFARAAVLSACETNLGAVRGEGVLGLSRAFILARVPVTIVSCWKVRDSFASIYMERLYKQLSKPGARVAICMQEVAIELMKETKKSHLTFMQLPPKYSLLDWAAFTCVGYPYVQFPTQVTC